jgi:hypothetical protein
MERVKKTKIKKMERAKGRRMKKRKRMKERKIQVRVARVVLARARTNLGTEKIQILTLRAKERKKKIQVPVDREVPV